MPFTYAYPHPAVTVDVVIFTIREHALQVLLIKRGEAPFRNQWALPGGFLRQDESLDAAARRELEEETGVRDVYLEQLYTFGEPGRDPRERVVSVAYFALIRAEAQALRATTDAADVTWFPMAEVPRLAFDHGEILAVAWERLKNKLEYTTVGFQLLPDKFTLSELQAVYEIILEKKLDKRNFRRKMALLDILEGLDERKLEGVHRPAQLFRFKAASFEKLKDKGILFPF
jgi:8-oxo-dGTP diphosphatase